MFSTMTMMVPWPPVIPGNRVWPLAQISSILYSLCGSDNQDIVNFAEHTREEHSSMESQDICPYSPNISSCQTLNEENIRNQDYDLAVENKNEIQSSHGQSLTKERGKVKII